MNMFQFAKLQNIEEHNFHNVLEDFYKMGIRGLVRENLQNSLDAQLTPERPVRVKIAYGELATTVIPGIAELKARINCLQGKNQYSQATIQRMQEAIQAPTVQYISFEDCETKGLSGAANGQSNDEADTFGVYAYSKGVHGVEADPEKEKVRGGSHGIGKIASNSASDIYLMYFANCDANGDQHLGGTIQLIEHEYEGAYYRATGYFAKAEENEHHQVQKFPYPNRFHSIFAKTTRGLKIIVPFLRAGFADEVEIIRTVCDSFLIAILEGNLIVEVNEQQIDQTSIQRYLSDPTYYETEVSEMKQTFTPLYARTYTTVAPQELAIRTQTQTLKFQLYFTYDEAIPTGRMAIFRTVGMKIADYKVRNNVRKPFNAVLIGGADEDVYLKSLENESHTDLSTTHMKDATSKRQANQFLTRLNNELDRIIKAEMQARNPVDGVLDTADIIYLLETQFKTEIEQAGGSVSLNDGRHLKRTDDSKRSRNPQSKRERVRKESGTMRKRQRPKPTLTPNAQRDQQQYRVEANIVKRIIINDQERLQFDFSNEPLMKQTRQCNLYFEVIDGMGLQTDFSLAHNYVAVHDQKTHAQYPLVGNMVQGVAIPENGKIELLVTLKPRYNKTLKFNYVVEV